MTETDQNQSVEARIKEVERLVENIRDELIGVQASILIFQTPQRWISAMEKRGIRRGLQFSFYLQQTIIVASMQSLCRLWDPRKRRYKKIGFCDLMHLLTDDLMDALESRGLDRLWEYKSIPETYETKCARVKSQRSDLKPRVEALRISYEGCATRRIPCSHLKETRDKWISHNDLDFNSKIIDRALVEITPFLDQTRECLRDINAFVRDADFSWESVIIPIQHDVALFLGETQTTRFA